MTDPRLHRLAEHAAKRIARGLDPFQVVLDALASACGREALPAIYQQLPRRSRAVCLALWGEAPMRARDVHAIIGGSHHSINELLKRLCRHGFVVRTHYAHYAIPPAVDVPDHRPTLSPPPAGPRVPAGVVDAAEAGSKRRRLVA